MAKKTIKRAVPTKRGAAKKSAKSVSVSKKTSKKSVKRPVKRVASKASAPKKDTRPKQTEPLFDIGKLSFVFGVFLSLFFGVIIGTQDAKLTLGIGIVYGLIFVLGLIVGIMNITVEEINEFLLACIAFLAAGSLNVFFISGALPVFGGIIQATFVSLSTFVAPAATIVAMKAMYELARKR